MESSSFITLIEKYFNRFSYQEQQLTKPVNKTLSLIVVIPCYNEVDLLKSLHSLTLCKIPIDTTLKS